MGYDFGATYTILGSIIFIVFFIVGFPMLVSYLCRNNEEEERERIEYMKEIEKRERERKLKIEREKKEKVLKPYNDLLNGNCSREYKEMQTQLIKYWEDENYIYFSQHFAYDKYILFKFKRDEGRQIANNDLILISYCYDGVYDNMPIFNCTLIRNLTVMSEMRKPNLDGMKIKTTSTSYRITKRF